MTKDQHRNQESSLYLDRESRFQKSIISKDMLRLRNWDKLPSLSFLDICSQQLLVVALEAFRAFDLIEIKNTEN